MREAVGAVFLEYVGGEEFVLISTGGYSCILGDKHVVKFQYNTPLSYTYYPFSILG